MATYNIADMIEQVVDAVPEWTAIVTEDRQFTYAQLEERANRLADFLPGQGVEANYPWAREFAVESLGVQAQTG